MEKSILIVEDDLTSAKLLEEVVASAGIKAVMTGNGREALDVFRKSPFPVVITDIEMPVMSGKELIDQLMSLELPPVIIVQTVHAELPTVIDVMKSGAYDYVVKPIDISEFQVKVERALEAAELRRMQKIAEREKVIRVERELEWYRWNDSVVNREMKRLDRSLFHSLHTAFNQGAGFGGLLTLLKILTENARKENEHYIIDAQLVDLIKDNVAISDKIIKTFSDIDRMISQEIQGETVGYDDFYSITLTVAESLKIYAEIKEQRITVSEKKAVHSDKKLKINREYFERALEELLINACKFSVPKSPVYVFVEIIDRDLHLSVVSEPVKDEQGRVGIPLGYENIVLEPFFRMTKAVYEGYNTMDYGLGLTLVDKIIKSHKGTIRISNIMDYTELSHDPEIKVMVSMILPLED